MTSYIITENNQIIIRSTVRTATDANMINHRGNPLFLDKRGKSIDSDPPHIHHPEDINLVSSIDTRKDDPIISFGQDLSDIRSQDDYSHDKLHHDAPNIHLAYFILKWTSPEGHYKGEIRCIRQQLSNHIYEQIR